MGGGMHLFNCVLYNFHDSKGQDETDSKWAGNPIFNITKMDLWTEKLVGLYSVEDFCCIAEQNASQKVNIAILKNLDLVLNYYQHSVGK